MYFTAMYSCTYVHRIISQIMKETNCQREPALGSMLIGNISNLEDAKSGSTSCKPVFKAQSLQYRFSFKMLLGY